MTPSKHAIRFFISVLLNLGSETLLKMAANVTPQPLIRPSPGIVTCRGQGRSCRAGPEASARQRLRDEAAHVRSRRSAPQFPDISCTRELRQNASLLHSCYIVLP